MFLLLCNWVSNDKICEIKSVKLIIYFVKMSYYEYDNSSKLQFLSWKELSDFHVTVFFTRILNILLKLRCSCDFKASASESQEMFHESVYVLYWCGDLISVKIQKFQWHNIHNTVVAVWVIQALKYTTDTIQLKRSVVPSWSTIRSWRFYQVLFLQVPFFAPTGVLRWS